MLNDTFWNYVNEIQSICMGADPTNQNFSRKYSSITRDRLLLDVSNKSSLDLYQYFYIKQGKQVYLDNQNDLFNLKGGVYCFFLKNYSDSQCC
jgi:hypothetical protein